MHSLAIIENDPFLKSFEPQIINRIQWYQNLKKYIKRHFGSIERFASAHKFFGFNYDEEKKGWWFREWLPNAHYVSLIGDFNNWDRGAHPLRRGNFGAWEIFLSDAEYKDKLLPFSKIKMHVYGENGALDRIPAYIKRVIQNKDGSFDGQFIGKSDFRWTDKKFSPKKIKTPFVYEAHIGMATEEEKVGSYREFADNILPRIHELGYNCVQLMAIQEHPYYGSFGYQVSNFFAPSSRFGTPDDLRYLIDQAHHMDIAVILDVVHSHAVKNRDEGLAELDGTEQYFSGWHPDWDSRLFDYSKLEVKRFLASNLKYWMEEFHFDGFRFDGVTSMLYHHFGHVAFDSYAPYFKDTNNDAILYLQLANELIDSVNPHAISICEEMSGMPGACLAVEDGGLGFDYRLGMGIPDFWIKTLKNKKDQDWNMGDMYWHLTNRRENEKTIAYAESHDQALVGDKTIAFWLMDREMYTGMSVFEDNIAIERGIALHKMIRLVTAALGGEGYMTFMGNEFGHPEWVDFPRANNGWSHKYARRQWSLPDTDHLKYKYLERFDKQMIELLKKHKILSKKDCHKLIENSDNGILGFSKGKHIFLFNFGVESQPNVTFPLKTKDEFEVIFNSDDKQFGGFDILDEKHKYKAKNGKMSVYLPSRTAIVLAKKKKK